MDKNKTNKTPAVISETLLQELEALRDAIVSLSGTHNNNEKMLAIVRLLSGFSREDWHRLAEKYGLGQWLAIDLNESNTQNLTALYEEMNELAFQKDHDPLTSLPNRRMFMRSFEIELQRRERYNADLSVVSLDIDHFKVVNDTWGHAVGDEVLKELGKKLITSKRIYDIAARIGGEEFAMLLPGSGAHRAQFIVQRILNDFRETPFIAPDGTQFNVTFSAGITSVKGSKTTKIDEILNIADKALYQAKNSGRNKIVVIPPIKEIVDKKSMVHSDEKHFLFTGIHK